MCSCGGRIAAAASSRRRAARRPTLPTPRALDASPQARLRREAIEERKRANKLELEYKRQQRVLEHQSLDIKALKTALKSREQLDSLYLTRLEWNNFEREFRRSEANAENFRCVFNSKLDRQGKLLVALAVKNGWWEGVPVPVSGMAVQLEEIGRAHV